LTYPQNARRERIRAGSDAAHHEESRKLVATH
jgi:hypothetical protein